MNDLYLKFPDEATANSFLYTTTPNLAVVDPEGNVITPAGDPTITPNFANIDVLGTLYATPPNPLPDDYVPVAMDGFHVNIRSIGEDTSAIESFSIVPAFPRRVWG